MKIKTRLARLVMAINKRLGLRASKGQDRSGSTESSGEQEEISGLQEFTNLSFVEEAAPVKTSTPRKQHPFKIILIQEVSNLKIYEDFDELDQVNNNNNNNNSNHQRDESLDISAVTVYENLVHFQHNNYGYFPKSCDYIPYIEESGYKIYEDVGESFVVE